MDKQKIIKEALREIGIDLDNQKTVGSNEPNSFTIKAIEKAIDLTVEECRK
jgi:hypothetical protein